MAVFTYLHQWSLEKKFEKKLGKKKEKTALDPHYCLANLKKKKHQNFLMDLFTLLLDMFHCSERSLRFALDRLRLGLG